LDDELIAVIGQIEAAPFDPAAWDVALRGVAEVAGGWGGQLLAIQGGVFRFYLAGGVPDELLIEHGARGGADPAVSPRARALFSGPTMRAVTDHDFIPEADRHRHPFYCEFLDRVDTPFVNLGVLAGHGDLRIAAAACRTRRQGPASAEQQARFEALFPSLLAAARLQMRLEHQAALISLGALERLGLPAVLCDFAGRIVALSAPAERLLQDGGLVVSRGGSLHAAEPRSDRELQAAIARAAAAGPTANLILASRAGVVLLSSADGRRAVSADVAPMALGPAAFGLPARVMVLLGGAVAGASDETLMQLGLTRVEAEVARALADGLKPSAIAEQRGVGLETVRSQIKSSFAKLGVNSRAELTARLRDLR
jgi:DNA-binding CsgD family transcriptional regulator